MLRTLYPYVTVATYFLAVDDEGGEYTAGLFDASYSPKPAAAVFADFVTSS